MRLRYKIILIILAAAAGVYLLIAFNIPAVVIHTLYNVKLFIVTLFEWAILNFGRFVLGWVLPLALIYYFIRLVIWLIRRAVSN